MKPFKYLHLLLLLPFALMPQVALTKNGRSAATQNDSVCGSRSEILRSAFAREKYHESRLRLAGRETGVSTSPIPQIDALQQDVGDVTVIEDDGTIIAALNPFDLVGQSFRFVAVTSSTYRVVPATLAFDSAGGTSIRLGDDDSFDLALPAPFTFFGQAYSNVHVNSDGNLTFLQSDTASTDRDIGRFASGPPRIGPFFADLDPSVGGTVSYRHDSDGTLIVWNGVPAWAQGAPSEFNSFSVKLLRTGNIEIVIGTPMNTRDAVVGISPGNYQGGITAVDLSAATPELSGTIAEVFATRMTVSESAVARKFFQMHPDSFDHLNLFLGFSYDLGGGAFAYELPVKNEIKGIGEIIPGQQVFDFSAGYGSNGRLRSFLNMGTLSRYPNDPSQLVPGLGTNSTLGVMGQESGHRWEAFTPFRDGSSDSTEILGRDLAHWSFFFNSDGSVMEGNQIQDRGANQGSARFVTVAATNTYSKLDQYIMGLVSKDLVPPMFFVHPVPTLSYPVPGSAPRIGISFGGIRRDFTIDDIIAANGPRIPSALEAPKIFRQAFIYFVPKGQAVNTADVAKVQRIRDAWVKFFNEQTQGLGWIVSDLQDSPGTRPSAILFPYFQGNPNRYTGVAVANWGTTPADVLFTAFDNSGKPMSTPGSIVNPLMVTIAPGAQIADVAEKMHGLSLSDPHNGWIRAQSTSSNVSGFFLDGDSAQTMLSGAVAGEQTSKSLFFMRAQLSSATSPGNTYRNLINVVNPDSANALQVTFTLRDDKGAQVGAAATRSIPALGRMSEDLASLIPGISAPRLNGYLTVTGNAGVVAYQSIDTGATLFSLPAVPASNSAQLYGAQFASGLAGSIRYFSELNLINTSAQARTVRLQLVGNDGHAVVQPVTLPTLLPGQQYRERGEIIFGLDSPMETTSLVQGSVVVTADGPGIIGDVTFGDPEKGRFIAALPLDGNPSNNLVLSQVAQGSAGGGKPYFTGVAMYNPGSTDVNITLDVYSGLGGITGTKSLTLPGGNRISQTLPQLVNTVQEQRGGYIRINVNGGSVISFGLFGTQNLDFLAAIPAQIITP